MKALDLDGVLCTMASLSELNEATTNLEKLEIFLRQQPLHSPREFGYDKGDVVMVITARLPEHHDDTLEWLQIHYPEYTFDLHTVGYDKDTAKRKIDVMKTHGVTDYYDDREDWCDIVRSVGIRATVVK